jgi:hypothetical protein
MASKIERIDRGGGLAGSKARDPSGAAFGSYESLAAHETWADLLRRKGLQASTRMVASRCRRGSELPTGSVGLRRVSSDAGAGPRRAEDLSALDPPGHPRDCLRRLW